MNFGSKNFRFYFEDSKHCKRPLIGALTDTSGMSGALVNNPARIDDGVHAYYLLDSIIN